VPAKATNNRWSIGVASDALRKGLPQSSVDQINRGMLKCLITEHGKFRFILTPFVATVLLITAGVTYAQQNCTDDGSGPYGSLLNEE
jgi:hypothetical protein